MLIRDTLRLYLGWGSLLALASCGGRTGDDALTNAVPFGGATSTATSRVGHDTPVGPSMGGNEGTGGTANVFTSPMGGTASIGSAETAFGGAAMVSFGGACAVYYGGTTYTTLVSPTLCGNGKV